MRIEALTFFRFIAAIIVVAHHFDNHLVSRDFVNQMVAFFFVLSGFVLTIAYYPKPEFSTKSFWIKRVARIVPVYLIALALMIYFLPKTTLTAIILNLTFLQSWFPSYPLSINSPAWTLSVEIFFYLAFPFILAYVKRISSFRFTMVAVTFWVFTQMILMGLHNSSFYSGLLSSSDDLIYFFPISHLCSFLLGVCAANIFLENREKWHIPAQYSLALISFMFALIFYSDNVEEMIGSLVGRKWDVAGSFYAPVYVALIFVIALSDNFFTKTLSLKFPVFLGGISYEFYILQFPVYIMVNHWVLPFFHVDDMGHFALYLSFLITISIITFYWIEKPSKRLAQSFLNRINPLSQ